MRRPRQTDPFLYCQPDKAFVEELKKPVHSERPPYFDTREKESGEVRTKGLFLDITQEFQDELLETAYADFDTFAKVYEIAGDQYPIKVRKGITSVFEEYQIMTEEDGTVLLANDTEGIRRGLIYIEDELRRREGAFLPKGRITRTPWLKSRITRCFFSPINRPPNNGEELADDIDYYPEEYLNRLAHDGSNGVWIYTKFQDLLPSKIIPEYGQDSERRLDKLNRTIEKCRRYGVKVFVFAIEPAALKGEIAQKYSDINGAKAWDGHTFCAASERGKAYCKEALETLFTLCPNAAGALILTAGERTTNCSGGEIHTCPNCHDKGAGEVLAQAVDAMREGMREVKPDAEFLSWTYGHRNWAMEDIEEYVRLIPEDAAMIQNFEDTGLENQLGKNRQALDYWLSYVGPSEMFKKTAEAAKKYGKTLYTKTQVCCSHETASVPYVPVPGILFDKYKGMYELGVKGVMQCWYFGNYPSLMNKAAGEFAFWDDFSDKAAFLKYLAGIYWGRTKADKVVEAWNYFDEGYRNYPVNIMFSYYGPMHDGPVWLLQLLPKNFQLVRSWQYGDMLDGDRINEAFLCGHTLDEIVTLCQIMHENWKKGTALMNGLEITGEIEKEQYFVANALDCQFESGLNILKFYQLRDKLGHMEEDPGKLLAEMEALVKEEIKISRKLAEISAADNRLGYHSEAEGFKYFPAKLTNRADYLEKLLETEFVVVRERIAQGKLPLEYYAGVEEGAPRYKLGSGWSDMSDPSAQVKLQEDGDDLVIEFRSKKEEEITVSPEINLFKFEAPIYIKKNGTAHVPWRVWMYFDLLPEDREKELTKYSVKLLPPDAEYPGSHYEVRIHRSMYGWKGTPMKIAIRTNFDDINPNNQWVKTDDPVVYLGKYDIHPDNFVWLDRE